MSDEKHEETIFYKLSSVLIRVQSLEWSTMILFKQNISIFFCLEAAVLMLLFYSIQQSLFRWI